MATLREFIVERLSQLDAEEGPLRKRLQAISEESEQLRAAAAAAGIPVHDGPSEIAKAMEIMRRPQRRSIPEKTIKDAVIEVLKAKGSGMTALEILAAINQRFSTDYPRTSLSPQLSRLKAEEKLIREGIVWRLSDKEEKSAPDKSSGALF
jgi:hypothetical protein